MIRKSSLCPLNYVSMLPFGEVMFYLRGLKRRKERLGLREGWKKDLRTNFFHTTTSKITTPNSITLGKNTRV